MCVELVLFDLDETLAPDEETNAGLLAAIARDLSAHHGVARPPFLAALRDVAHDLWERGPAAAYADRLGISSTEGLWGPFGPSDDPMLAALNAFVPGYRLEVWSRALAAGGVRDMALAADLAARFAAERAARQHPYPWAPKVLTKLRARFRLGMITNGAPDLQRLKLSGAGLTAFFDPLVVSGDLGVGKPEATIFAHALALAGVVDPAMAVMVGDSWHRDILGAINAGLRAIWINPAGAAFPALDAASRGIQAISDVRALPPLLMEP